MRFILSFFLLNFSLSLSAQVSLKSLEECILYAKENNLELRNLKLRQESNQENLRQAKSVLLPQVKASVVQDNYFSLPVQLIPEVIFGGNEGEFREVQFGTKYNLSASIEANLPLINFNYWNQVNISKYTTKIVETQYKAKIFEIEERVSKGYYLILLNKLTVEIAEKNFANNDTLLKSAEQKLKNGLIEPLEYNRLKAIYLQSRQNKEDNQLILKKNSNALKILLGIEADNSLVLTEELKDPQISTSYLSSDFKKYPNYQTLELQLNQSTLSLKNEKQRRLPELSLYARFTEQAQRNEYNFLASGQPWFEIGLAGFRLDIPIFTGFNRNASIQKARINQKITETEMLAYTQKIRIEDEEIQLNYQQAVNNFQTVKEIYELSRQNYQKALFKYRNGVYSPDQLINVYNEQLIAQNQYVGKFTDYLVYKSQIEIRNNFNQ